MADEDSLVSRRPRRSTAGNMMAIAMAELATEDPELEAEEDADFAEPEDEKEIFDSDFQSTDEDEMQENIAGDSEIVDEEKRDKQAARQRVRRATEAAASRQRVTFQADSQNSAASTSKLKEKRVLRRVSLGIAVNAETGEILKPESKRKSRRQSTMLNSQVLHSRLRDAEKRRASIPKKTKEAARRLTQAELIAQALDNEEGNIAEHKNYLSLEEEKRRRAQVVRKSISGPVLRWISKIEEVKTPIDVFPAQPRGGSSEHQAFVQPHHSHNIRQTEGDATNQTILTAPQSGTSFLPDSSSAPGSDVVFSAQPDSSIEPPTQEQPRIKIEKVAKNYLIHESGQVTGISKPSWEETMRTVFGDHVQWETLKVYTSKNRPYARPVIRCPITGRIALYRDPRTGVPFANQQAYDTLTRLLAHEYIWNEELGCYTG